ncbi:WXG100 family type VII secretion target [Kitasatospora purpeofusca]|uniref:WXG100 family type VII secretion target n=1 Tax=Kitasatospora purpeofusca TaxID=67352 RepID=UPI0036947C96
MADPDLKLGQGPGGGPTKVSTGALDKAATALDGIATDSTAAGRTADESTEAAAGRLSGWDTAAALRGAVKEWHEQVSQLNGRLNQEAGMMRQTHTNYLNVEHGIASSFGGNGTPFAGNGAGG